MAKRRIKFTLWFAALVIVISCAPLLSPASRSAPTIDPNAVNQIIAQTANAAATQTSAAASTLTPTETPTRLPTNTAPGDPTATNTVIFEFFTFTPFVIPPAQGTFNPTSNKDFACEVLDSPPNDTIYSPRKEFNVRWRLKNVGRKAWEEENVDFIFDMGDRFYKVKGYDLKKKIDIGYVAEFFVEMEAPKDPGTYTTYWTLKSGTTKFCRVSLTIGVK